MTYYRQIDSFRFFAAFLVLVAHWLHFLPIVNQLKLSFIGVDFFFVLSGFLITNQLFEIRERIASHQVKFKTALRFFYIRRSIRIFPLYFFVLLLTTAFNNGEIRDAFLFNLTYTSNFYIIKVQSWPSIFSQFWSLSVEEHFYIFWPIIVLFFNKKIVTIIAIFVSLFAVAFRYFVFTNSLDYFSVYIHTFSCLDVFMFGGLLAFFFNQKKDSFLMVFSNRTIRYCFLIGFLIAYAYLIFFEASNSVYTWVFFRSIFGVFSAMLVGMLIIGFKGPLKLIFENKLLLRGGKLSYAIYLIHNFIPGILLGIKKLNLPLFLEFTIYFITTILISEILYRLIESPIRKIGYKYKLIK